MVRAAALEQQFLRKEDASQHLDMLNDPTSLQALLAAMLANVRNPSFDAPVSPGFFLVFLL